MESITALFTEASIASTIVIISLAAFLGIMLGKITVKKINLGIAGVLFSGLALAHFGVVADIHVLHFVREFGLILFVYAIGIDIGPRFLSSFKNDGVRLNLFALSIVLMGFGIAYGIHYFFDVSPAVITGIMSGAVTNTPGLGAAQQVLTDIGQADDAALTGMAYALAYPFGIIGIILTMLLVRLMFKVSLPQEEAEYNSSIGASTKKLEGVQIRVTNPNMFGKTVKAVQDSVDADIVLSRIERNGTFLVAIEKEVIQENDTLYGVTVVDAMEQISITMGDVQPTQKREVTGDLAMFHVLVTNKNITGKTIEQIGIYRRYEANITRIYRGGIEILPTRKTTVEKGDTVRIVGKRDILPEIRRELGNSVKELAHPNVIPIFLGIFLGVIVGTIPLAIPGLPYPAKLGMAGGPLLVAIFFGHKGRIKQFSFYMTPGANLMLKEIGIVLFLACVGIMSGGQFVETLMNGGATWILYGMAITFIPVFTVAVISRILKLNYLKICGFISGAMTDPPALEFANSIAPVPAQSTAYATVYPFTMFLRILAAQLLILITL